VGEYGSTPTSRDRERRGSRGRDRCICLRVPGPMDVPSSPGSAEHAGHPRQLGRTKGRTQRQPRSHDSEVTLKHPWPTPRIRRCEARSEVEGGVPTPIDLPPTRRVRCGEGEGVYVQHVRFECNIHSCLMCQARVACRSTGWTHRKKSTLTYLKRIRPRDSRLGQCISARRRRGKLEEAPGGVANRLVPPCHLRATAPPPPDAPSVAWGVRSPRGSRATRVVGGGAPPPEQERAPKQCISCPNVHQTRLIQWETTFITCPKRSGPPPPAMGPGRPGGSDPLPRSATRAARGAAPPRSGDGPPSDWQGGYTKRFATPPARCRFPRALVG